jgi:hypothetical protein
MARVWVNHGEEGPRHDPYGWTEINVRKTDGTHVMIRVGGLGYERLYVNGHKLVESFGDDLAVGNEFLRLTGLTPDEAEDIPQRVTRNRLRRMSPIDRWQEQMFIDADQRMMSYAR